MVTRNINANTATQVNADKFRNQTEGGHPGYGDGDRDSGTVS